MLSYRLDLTLEHAVSSDEETSCASLHGPLSGFQNGARETVADPLGDWCHAFK